VPPPFRNVPFEGGAQGDATITGRVRGLERATRVDGRTIEVVDIDSGTRQRALTHAAGGFAFTLRTGPVPPADLAS
jgi:hypothetical protein